MPTINVLTMGQSLSIGRGTGGASFSQISSAVKVWNNGEGWGANGTAFVTPTLSSGPYDPSGGNNPSVWFCERLAQRTNSDVRQVLVSKGAQGIHQWVTSDDGADPGVDELVDVVAAIEGAGNTVRPFDVFIWQGGESNDGHTRVQYRSWWDEMIGVLVSGNYITSSTPVIMGGIAKASASHIDLEHQAIAASADRFCYAPLFDSMSTTDGVHLTGASSVTMGASIFCAWQDWQINHGGQ